jgi:hypothetical protein
MFAEPAGDSSEPIWKIYSDDAVLAEYWDYWLDKMNEYNAKHDFVEGTNCSPMRCINDWVGTHWAVAATPENLKNIIAASKPELIKG